MSEISGDLRIEDGRISRKEIRGVSNRISAIDKRLDVLGGERKTARKELSRIEAYSRITQQGRMGRVKISDIKDIARSGGSLSTAEMGAFLDIGGLSSLGEEPDTEPEPAVEKRQKKKGRKLGVARSGSRKGNLATRKEE